MRHGDGHSRRVAWSRRCNVVDDRMNRLLDVAAAAAVAEDNDLMKHPCDVAAAEAEAEVVDRLKRTFVYAACVSLVSLLSFVTLSMLSSLSSKTTQERSTIFVESSLFSS